LRGHRHARGRARVPDRARDRRRARRARRHAGACTPARAAATLRPRGGVDRHDELMTSSYDDHNVFAKILRGEVPADVAYADDRCLAFRDIDAKAPTHVLVIPKAPITGLGAATPADEALLGHL